jgi:tetratricopeptide (TPR) repeat protein
MDNGGRQTSSPGRRVAVSRDTLVCLCLGVVTLAVYCRVAGFDFCNYDDFSMVYENPAVMAGLTWHGFFWALTTSYFDFWHPVAWWSHMLDCELFGLSAGWHHMVNVAFHAANTLLLFRVLQRMTGAWKRSALVAALFALHPLHVESVAWVAERKDVLSTFLFLLALGAYVRYVAEIGTQKSRAGRFYLLTLLFFALGLATKPMLVTFPFVLLLLDYWPLGRLAGGGWRVTRFGVQVPQLSTLNHLLYEKLPFFGLTLASCVITYLGTKWGDHFVSGPTATWGFRLSNAAVAYVRYLGKMVWPEGLIVYYPSPDHWESWQWLGAALILLLITGFISSRLRKQPYLIFGWLWFLGTLVPVIGIGANNSASLADRYMYIPSIGLFVAVVWALADMAIRWKLTPFLISGTAGTVLLVFGVISWVQVGYWRNSITLWTHCLAVNPVNDAAQFQLGWTLGRAGRYDEAMEHYREALRINPHLQRANLNIGELLALKGDFRESTNYIAREIKINPRYAKAHESMGIVLLELGDYARAVEECTNVSLLGAKDEKALTGVAMALGEAGRSDEAVGYYAKALQLNPDNGEALNNLAWILAASSNDGLRNGAEAVRLAEHACELTHYHEPLFIGTLAAAYAEAGRFSEAVTTAEKAEQLAAVAGLEDLAGKNRQLLELYRAKKPYHEAAVTKP